MPGFNFSPALSALAALTRFTPPQPVQTFFRSAGYKLRPPSPRPWLCAVTRAQDDVLARGLAEPRQRAVLLHEPRSGPTPTIVLGGFVPDSTEQVFLLRGFLLRRGSVYYFNYPRGGFSPALICAQLDDLVGELTVIHGRRPVIFAVSFGAGLALDWLRRARAAGRTPDLAGLVFVSPVACGADVLTPGEAKPPTLLGRAFKSCLETGEGGAGIAKSRAIFARMFEAGAQNHRSLRALLTADELRHLRGAVLGAIRHIDARGATERVQALQNMPSLSVWEMPDRRPLIAAPALVLYAEKESAVLVASSPTRAAFESALTAFFPAGSLQTVTSRSARNPVQHASLIFHHFEFFAPVAAFYQRLKSGKTRLAA